MISISMLMFSCSKQEVNTAHIDAQQNEIDGLSVRSELSYSDFFDATPCGNIVEESAIFTEEYCTVKRLVGGTYSCDLYPGCVFTPTVDYMVCTYPITGLKGVFVNEPVIGSSGCAAFDAARANCRFGECNQLFADLYNCLIPQIEVDIWTIELPFPDCNSGPIATVSNSSITWINASCNAFRWQESLSGELTIQRIFCSETGCCLRETKLCKENGEIVSNVRIRNLSPPTSQCPSEISDPSAEYGYTECVFECEQ